MAETSKKQQPHMKWEKPKKKKKKKKKKEKKLSNHARIM